MTTPRAGAGPTPGPDPGAGQAPPDRDWRLFVAIDVPGSVRSALAAVRAHAPPWTGRFVRWAPPDGVHLTLRFLGDVEPRRVDDIRPRLDDAAARSGRFLLRLGDPGAFPSLRRPRVLWIGIDGELDRLRRLHTRLEGGLTRAGFPAEDRPLTPHLTAGRVRPEASTRDLSDLGRGFASSPLPSPRPEFEVTGIVLFRSYLAPGGARYERLHEAPLG